MPERTSFIRVKYFIHTDDKAKEIRSYVTGGLVSFEDAVRQAVRDELSIPGFIDVLAIDFLPPNEVTVHDA